MPAVSRVKVRWVVIAEEHQNRDSVEGTNPGHGIKVPARCDMFDSQARAEGDQESPVCPRPVPFPGRATPLSSAVDVSSMFDPMDYHDLLFFENLVDDPVVATTSRNQAFKLAKQWFTKPSWILGNWSEYSSESCLSDLGRQLIEVSEPFRCDFDLIHRGFSDNVSKGKSLPSRRFLT